MLQALRERRHDDQGFTLIELMIVILIIGILIAVGLPTFLGARERAQDRAAQALLRTGMAAAKTWYTDSNTYTGFDTVANAQTIEQSIVWVNGSSCTRVGDVCAAVSTGGSAGKAVTLLTVSGSGVTFCLKDVAGATSGNGTFYSRGASGCGTTWYLVSGGWVATPSGAPTGSPGA